MTAKKKTPKDTPEMAALKAQALACEKAKWVANAKAELAKEAAALLPFSEVVICPKCGKVIHKSIYCRDCQPYCCDPYANPNDNFITWWPYNHRGNVEQLSWACSCGHRVSTRPKDAL